MTNHKSTFPILILILIPLLSACGADGTEPPVSTDTSGQPTMLYFWAQW